VAEAFSLHRRLLARCFEYPAFLFALQIMQSLHSSAWVNVRESDPKLTSFRKRRLRHFSHLGHCRQKVFSIFFFNTKRLALKRCFASPPRCSRKLSPALSILARPAVCPPSRIGTLLGSSLMTSKSALSRRSSSSIELFMAGPMFSGEARSAGIGRPAPLAARLDLARSNVHRSRRLARAPVLVVPGTE
jgi:hypothetical protein